MTPQPKPPNLFDTDTNAEKSRIAPSRHLSVFAGKRFRLDYREGKVTASIIGRIQDLQPHLSDDGAVTGVRVLYWPGSYAKAADAWHWRQEQHPLLHNFGPFDHVELLKYEMREDKDQETPDLVEWDRRIFRLSGPTRVGELKILD